MQKNNYSINNLEYIIYLNKEHFLAIELFKCFENKLQVFGNRQK